MSRNNRSRLLLSAAIWLTLANFGGKLLGFLRDVLISNYYGATAQTDAFFLALSIPTILIGVFTSSADSAVVPQYTEISVSEEGRAGADRYFSNIIVILSIVASIIALVSLAAPQFILFFFAPTFQGTQLEAACLYMRIFSFAGLFHIWFCFFCAYLICYERTTIRILLSFSTNILVVVALLLVHDTGMYALSFAYLGGSVASAFLPIWASKRAGYHFYPVLSFRAHHFPEFTKRFLPIMGSALLADLLLYSDRLLSSFLPSGSLSALNYGSKIIGIFENIAVVGVGTILLTVLTRQINEKRMEAFRKTISSVLFCLFLLLFPVSLISILYAHDIVSFLFLRGAFTQENAELVSRVFQAYAFQILLTSMQMLLSKSFHAMGNTRLPFRISLVTFTENVILSVLLMQYLEINGIAIATTISTLTGCSILLIRLRQIIGLDHMFFRMKGLIKLVPCVAVLILPWMVPSRFSSSLFNVLIFGGVSFLLYLGAITLFYREELRACIKMLQE